MPPEGLLGVAPLVVVEEIISVLENCGMVQPEEVCFPTGRSAEPGKHYYSQSWSESGTSATWPIVRVMSWIRCARSSRADSYRAKRSGISLFGVPAGSRAVSEAASSMAIPAGAIVRPLPSCTKLVH